MRSECNLHFMVAHTRYLAEGGAEKGPYWAWVRRKVWYGLLETARRIAERQAILARSYLDPANLPAPARFDGPAFVAGLGGDAARVASLLLAPRGVPLAITEEMRGGPDRPANVLAGLETYLECGLRWGDRRVTAAFDKVCDEWRACL